MRLAAQYKGGFYPTPPRVVELVASLTQAARSPGDDNAAHPRPLLRGRGRARRSSPPASSAPTGPRVETYAVELHAERAKEAERRLDHALGTDLFQTAIANGAFGLLYLNPPYDDDSGEEEKRVEMRFLRHCTRYLCEQGLLVFVVPRRRLAECARYLASHYRSLRVWAFPEPEREAFDQVVVTGIRKADPQYDQYAAVALQEAIEGNLDELRPQRYPVYNAPATADGEVLFATRTVDPVAAAEESRRSGLWVSTTVTDALWPSEDSRTQAAHAAAARAPGDAGGGGVPRQPPARGRGRAHPRQRAAPRARRCCSSRPRARRRSTASGCAPRSSRSTSTSARSPTSPPDRSLPSGTHEAPPFPTGAGGLATSETEPRKENQRCKRPCSQSAATAAAGPSVRASRSSGPPRSTSTTTDAPSPPAVTAPSTSRTAAERGQRAPRTAA